jgi:predicted SnoaL-like aldol condensation-catalyzing enzyme
MAVTATSNQHTDVKRTIAFLSRGELGMSTDKNKAVVRQFIKMLGNGNTDLIDELLAPEYMNLSMGVTNRAGFKAVISGLKASMPARDFEIVDLVAEGDSVVFRGNMNVTLANGKKVLGPRYHLLPSR